jgi:xanthine dehydrogenase accessory factor
MGRRDFQSQGRAIAHSVTWAMAARLALASQAVALVTIIAVDGSAPLGAGARMVVSERGLLAGSIGGGALELQALKQAQAILAWAPGTWRVQDYPLGPLLGQCCGGRVRLVIEHIDPADASWLDDVTPDCVIRSDYHEGRIARRLIPDERATAHTTKEPRPEPGFTMVERIGTRARPVLLFGAGHVGIAMARAFAPLPFELHWYDSRPEFARPGVSVVDDDDLVKALLAADPAAAVLILTHDHGLDYRLTRAAIDRSFAFVGVIGSATKRARFLSRLTRDGVSDAERERMICPIGLAEVQGKDPAVIAIAVAAQLLGLPDR